MNHLKLKNELQLLLDKTCLLYNTPDFIRDDPIQIPHQFSRKEDIEISGFLTALIAWGRRDIIIRNAQRLITLMDGEPYQFVMEFEEQDLAPFRTFVHRTLNGEDCIGLLQSLQYVYQQQGGLEAIFSRPMNAQIDDVCPAILHARSYLLGHAAMLARTHKHIANPSKGSSAKRINMFLRWMVRKDDKGVDFGLWKSILPRQLICPLDVHTGTIARKLGLLDRKQNDWKAAKALTQTLQQFDPDDPVRYDYSLFGMGVYGVMG
ncbi:MAG: TIGR02757 family protein [Bacteroidota bacterium]